MKISLFCFVFVLGKDRDNEKWLQSSSSFLLFLGLISEFVLPCHFGIIITVRLWINKSTCSQNHFFGSIFKAVLATFPTACAIDELSFVFFGSMYERLGGTS